MRTCKSCGRENPADRDFCECGEYLRWELTRAVPAVGQGDIAQQLVHDANLTIAPTAAVAGPTAGAPAAFDSGEPRVDGGAAGSIPAGRVSLVLRMPGQEDVGAAIRLEVEPGSRATLFATIRNEGDIVDNYDIEVTGIPDDWWTATPPTAYLVPYGSSGTYEQEVKIELHPPKTPDAVARPWPFAVTAYSRASEGQVAAAPAMLVVGSYQQVSCELRPERASGKLKARFVLTVRNRANSPSDVVLAGTDSDGQCRFRFAEPSVIVQPGQAVEAPFRVFPPKQIWLGRPTERRLQVTATAAESPQPPAMCTAVFRQRAWLPWWLAVVAPLVIVALMLFVLLTPKQVKVPDLTKKTILAAQKLLNHDGLTLAPGEPRHVRSEGVPPGTIVEQSPSPGKKVNKGTIVSIFIAEGSGLDPVPPVTGKTPGQAESLLRASGLALGTVSPQPLNPSGKIVYQRPEAGQQVPSGTPVEVILAAPATAPKSSKLPPATGPATAVIGQLAQLGLAPVVRHIISTSPPGTVVETNPPAGTTPRQGSKVEVVESAGFPELSYDSEGFEHFVSGANGASAPGAPTSEHGEEAGWSADGTHVVYSVNGQLFLLSLTPPKPVQPLTAPGTKDYYPSFAPTTGSHIVAFLSGTSELCLAYVGASLSTPQCTSAAGWELGHQLTWSPDGRSILVTGVQHEGRTFGLINFVSKTAYSVRASDWHGSLVTDASHEKEGVIAGAVSPDHTHMALIADFGASGFNLYLAKPGDFAIPHATPLRVPACQLSWRPDSQALAVTKADNSCNEPAGTVLTLSLKNPTVAQQIATPASHPAWQPLSLK